MNRSPGRPPLPLDEAVKRPLKVVRIAASTSFTEDEVLGLDSMFALLRRGADARLILRSPAMMNVARKVVAMKATLERQRERRAAKLVAAEPAPAQLEEAPAAPVPCPVGCELDPAGLPCSTCGRGVSELPAESPPEEGV